MTQPANSAPDTGVRVSEMPPSARFSLRLRADRIEAAGHALGFGLPQRIGAITAHGNWRALCLGPDEWLLEGPDGTQPPLPPEGLPHALVDISNREIVFCIEGRHTLDLLSIGIARDLRRLAPGNGCRTAFDSAQAILIRETEASFTLAVWRSFAPMVSGLLSIGLRELETGL